MNTLNAYSQGFANIQKTAKYQNTVTIANNSDKENPSQIMALKLGWVPDGVTYDERMGEYTTEAGGGITPVFYKIPDGVNLLVMNLTYTNSTDKTKEKCICPNLFTFSNGNAYQIDRIPAPDADIYDDSLREISFDGGHFSFYSANCCGKNNIEIAPGESVNVQLAFLVGDDLDGNLYLNLDSYGQGTAFDYQHEAPMLDLCNID